MLPAKFQDNWPFDSEQVKNKVSRYGGHLGFLIKTILAIFNIHLVTLMLPTEFKVNWPFESGEKVKNRFSGWLHDGGHLGFLIGTILTIFNLQGIPMLPPKFRVKLPRGVSGVGFHIKLLTRHDRRQTMTNHKSSPSALRAQVS